MSWISTRLKETCHSKYKKNHLLPASEKWKKTKNIGLSFPLHYNWFISLLTLLLTVTSSFTSFFEDSAFIIFSWNCLSKSNSFIEQRIHNSTIEVVDNSAHRLNSSIGTTPLSPSLRFVERVSLSLKSSNFKVMKERRLLWQPNTTQAKHHLSWCWTNPQEMVPFETLLWLQSAAKSNIMKETGWKHSREENDDLTYSWIRRK